MREPTKETDAPAAAARSPRSKPQPTQYRVTYQHVPDDSARRQLLELLATLLVTAVQS